jgi:galactose mutarotase-like enzyme
VADPLLVCEDDGMLVEALPAVGGRVHRIQAFGVDLLHTPPSPAVHRQDPFFWGAYVMAPWCNRAPTDPVEIAGRRVELPANFPDGTAIHGQVYDAPWEVVDDATARIEAGGDGWPWRYEVRARYRAAPATFGLTLEVRNLDDGPMPAGLGPHAWFAKPVHVAVPAAQVLADNLTPPVDGQPVEPPFDLRRLGAMADGLDATWTGLTSHTVELAWPADDLHATLTFSEAAAFVVAASPGDKDAVAVEPQTHAPPALRRLLGHEPGAPALLDPGEVLAVDYELRVRRGG